MIFQKRKTNDDWILALEPEENLETLLLAIARASFETAEPQEMGWLNYNSEDTWESVKGQVHLFPKECSRRILLDLDYINGRRCKSCVWQRGSKLYFFPGTEREQDAQLILTMANDYLHGKRRIVPMKP